jgi:hypothetical protein
MYVYRRVCGAGKSAYASGQWGELSQKYLSYAA